MLTIYLTTHNRSASAIQAIKSIMAQTDYRFRFVASDNSSADKLLDLIIPCDDFVYIKLPKIQFEDTYGYG